MLILFWPMRAPSVSELSYLAFLSRVTAAEVATAVIDPSGAVTGTIDGADIEEALGQERPSEVTVVLDKEPIRS
jgi:hypothetical protein